MLNGFRNLRRYPIVLRGICAGSQPSGIRFLLYHKVSGELSLELDLAFRLFRRHMKFLHRTGNVIAYEEALRLLHAGVDLPHDLFVLTFDDGYRDFYSHAFPVLRDLGLPAILFITTGFIEHRVPCVLSAPPPQAVEPLSWEMVAELHDSRLITLGAHSHSHVDLPSVSEQRVIEELNESRELLRRRVGIAARHFAYPRARWSERVESLVKERYASAVMAGWNKASVDGFDPYRIPRVPIVKRDQWLFFLAKTRGWLEGERTLYDRIPS